jgi:hypothetical protein
MRKKTIRHSLPAQALIATLVGLIAFGPLSPLVRRAEANPNAAEPAFTFSFDVPNHGALDVYHNAFTMRDAISDSLYALRNTAMEDLLNSRKALKVLLGGTERARDRARALGHSGPIGFNVPSGVVDLYLLGRLGRNQDHSPLAQAQGRPVHGISTEGVPEVANAIHWLDGNEPAYDPELRYKLVRGLVYVSALLAKYDQQVKFVEKDFWADRRIDSQFYEEELEDWVRSVAMAGGQPDISTMYDFARKRWMADHKMGEVIAVLAGQREFLLDRYHLLGIEVAGKPLYHHVYRAMEAKGFPAASTVQAPVRPRLPSGTEPIPVPTGFDESVDRELNRLADGAAGEARLRELVDSVNDRIDQALLASLSANTARMAELTREVDYSGDRSSPLLELARLPELWDAAMDKYGYLGGIIDFAVARRDLDAYFERVDRTKRRMRYAAYGVGIGLGVVALVASGGTAGAFLGVGAKVWLAGSGLVMAAQASYDYMDSRAAAEVARGMYLGTVHQGTYARMRDAVMVAEQDFKIMVACLVTLGLELPILTMIARARTVVVAGGRTFVALTKSELATLRTAVEMVTKRARFLAPLGRALVMMGRGLVGLTSGVEGLVALEQAIPVVAARLRMAPALVRAKLEANPMIGYLIRGYRDRVMANPTFLQMMVREQAMNAVATLLAEISARGDRFRDELGQVALDFTTGAFITGALVWVAVKPAARLSVNGVRRPQTVFDPGFSGRERLNLFLENGKTNFLVSFTTTAAVRGGREIYDAATTEGGPGAAERAERTLMNALFGGTFTALSSNARIQAVMWSQRLINRHVAEGATRKIILSGLSFGNNWFGGWHYVKLAKWAGVEFENGHAEPVSEASQSGVMSNAPIAGPQLQDLGGAFLRLDGDDDSAAYMFDFLRDGEVAEAEQH